MEDDVVDKGNKDGHRYGYAGMKGVVEESKWGRNTAAQRYGEPRSPNMKPADASRPQAPEDQCSDKSYNDHANDWVRGRGENAGNKPGYVPGGGRAK